MKVFRLAVIGKDVSQSLSPDIHRFLFSALGESCVYDRVSVPEALSERIGGLFKEYDGFNVTIPYKESVIPFLSDIEAGAALFGAVNTVISEGRRGYNTDGAGFLFMLENEGIDIDGRSALVLGAGGAGKTVARALAQAGASVCIYNRSPDRLRSFAGQGMRALGQVPLMPFDLIVNATGVGMNGAAETPSVRWEGGAVAPVGERLLSLCQTAVDLIYRPEKTQFLRIAEDLGKRTVNGKAMLFYQAYLSDCIYLGRKPVRAEAEELKTIYFREEL